jgi:hypothetical protein
MVEGITIEVSPRPVTGDRGREMSMVSTAVAVELRVLAERGLVVGW